MLGLMGVTRRMRVFDASFDPMRVYYWSRWQVPC
jgi:cytochrome o ubiquinol oxidase subunit 1